MATFEGLIDKRQHPIAWYSLGLRWREKALLLLLVPVATVAIVRFVGMPHKPALLGIPLVIGCWLLFAVPDRIVRKRRAAKIDAITLPLDREAYARALDGKPVRGALRVRVEGADLKAPDLKGVDGTVKATPDALEIESPTILGAMPGWPAHNGRLNEWFEGLAHRVLEPLAQRQSITRITVEHVDRSA
jgi:hypothetical protein